MKKKVRKIISLVVLLIVSIFFMLIVLFPEQTYIKAWLACADIEDWFAKNEAIKVESASREKNSKAAHEWVRKAFGATVSEVVELKYDGRGTGWSDCSTFMIETPFANGVLWVSSKDQSVSGGLNIKEDPQFLHLYSNWVKKQVGIDDENVELEFGEAKKGSRMVGQPPFIDFKSITSIDNLEEQICENTKNYHLKSIDLKILNVSNKREWLSLAKSIKDKYIKNINSIMPFLIWDDKLVIKLYYYNVDLAFDRYNNIKMNKNDINFYYVQFDLKNNGIKYMFNYYDNTFATVLDNWLKDVNYE